MGGALGMDVDEDGFFLEEDGPDPAAARCGPGTVWDEDSGFCVVAEGAMEAAAAAAVAAAAEARGWFWWLCYFNPFAWLHWLLSMVMPAAVMWALDCVVLFLGCLVKWVYGCGGLLAVLSAPIPPAHLPSRPPSPRSAGMPDVSCAGCLGGAGGGWI